MATSLYKAIKELTPAPRHSSITPQGSAGYDNARENIDPNIRTQNVSTKTVSASNLIEANHLRANNSLIVSGSTLVVRDGNVGIGTTSPNAALTVLDSNGVGIKVRESDNGNDAIQIQGASNRGLIYMNYGGSETIRFDAQGNSFFNSGNVGIGTTVPDTTLSVSGGALSLNNYSTALISNNHAGQLKVSGGALIYVGTSGTLTTIAPA